jgi:cellulose synthase/poly-beta-1,6-N-acetylglucosamine synthase-like glycosyltransferase
MTALPFVSVVIPVLNGADRLPAALATLRKQTYPADRFEVLVVDGGSRDDSRAIATASGARVIDNPKRRVAPARNVGFAASRGDVVAFTDDDCTFPEEWISSAVEHLGDERIGGVSGPTLVPTEETPFGNAVAFLFEVANEVTGSVHRERVESEREVDDLPGCNCFFRRDALTQAMPVDESLVTAEDVELCVRVRGFGYRLLLVPGVRLWHHKRQNPRTLFTQMRRYAIGRLQVGRVNPTQLRAAHILAGIALPAAFLVTLALGIVSVPALARCLGIALAALAFLAGAGAMRRRSPWVGLWIPAVVVLVVAGWSIGFMLELVSPRERQAAAP